MRSFSLFILALCLVACASAQRPIEKNQLIRNGLLDSLWEVWNNVWDQVLYAYELLVQIGGIVMAQMVVVLTKLMLAGQLVWDMAQPIFVQLMYDLYQNPFDAKQLFQAAISQLNQLLAGK